MASHLFRNYSFKKINPDLLKSIQIIKEVKKRRAFFQFEARLLGEFEVLAWVLFEIFKLVFLIELLMLFGVLKRFNAKRQQIERVFKFVGYVVLRVSIISLRKSLDTYCIPDIISDRKITANQIYHPLIINCTTNTIHTSNKSVLLTGSNMSGKTSFIKAIGLKVIAGKTINTCFARSISFPVLKVF
jgi:DNA mismatch repair ATPase MutS